MKASKDRSEQFMHTTANSTLQPANSTSQLSSFPKCQLTPDSLLFGQQQKGGPGSGMPTNDRKGKSKAVDNGEQDFLALDIDGDRGESGRGGEGYQQMQLVEQQVSPLLSNCSAFLWRM
jgi:syntaxin 5